MKPKQKIKAYYQKTYATWDQISFSWKNQKKKKIYTKDLTLEFFIDLDQKEKLRILGGPIKTREFFISHLIRNPFVTEQKLIISLPVINKFPKCWVLYTDIEEIILKHLEKKH